MTKWLRYQIYVCITLVCMGCDGDVVTIWDETNGKDYKIYDTYEDADGNRGVIVFAKKENDSKTLIVLSADEAVLPWGKASQAVYVPDSAGQTISMRYGLLMLYKMCADGMDNYPAQAWCYAKNNGRSPYTGCWRLPSMMEWTRMDGLNIKKLNEALSRIGGTPISLQDYYWTCHEDYPGLPIWDDEENVDCDPAKRALCPTIQMLMEIDKSKWQKSQPYRVRAIKYIEYAKK